MSGLKLIGACVAGAAVVFCVFVFFSSGRSPRIAVIQSQEIIEKYQGFREAHSLYEAKVAEYTSAFEEKREAYEKRENRLKEKRGNLDDKQRVRIQKESEALKRELIAMGKRIEQQTRDEEERLLKGVYGKIDDFIGRYGKDKGYDVILGTNQSGNVVYVSDPVDITEEVIKKLNEEYIHGIRE